MGIDAEDMKELMNQAVVYVEVASVMAVGLKAIGELLAKGHDLTNAELQEHLSANRKIIDSNKVKIEATIARDTQ